MTGRFWAKTECNVIFGLMNDKFSMTNGDGQNKFIKKTEIAAQNVNLAVLTLKKYASDRSKIALVWESIAGECEKYTFFDLERFSNRIANVFKNFGIGYGDRVFTLMNRTPELYATIPAVLKIGASVGVLFADFGAEAIRQRLDDAGAKAIVTDTANVEKIEEIFEKLPNLETVLVAGDWETRAAFYSFSELVEKAPVEFAAEFV